jgi:hypothetical protein
MKKKPAKRSTTQTKTRTAKDLPAIKGGTISGGSSVSNVLKTRHDTAKNSISNIR